jgi:hypothetical protein
MFLQLMEMLFGKNISSLLMSLELAFFLLLNLMFISQIITTKIPYIRDCFWIIRDLLLATNGYVEIGSQRYQSLPMIISNYFNNPSFLIAIIVLILAILLFLICILLNRKIKVEKIAEDFMFNFSKVIFKILSSSAFILVTSLFLGFIIYAFYQLITKTLITTDLIRMYGLAGKENIEQTLYLIIDLAFIPLNILVYKFLSKLMKKREVA